MSRIRIGTFEFMMLIVGLIGAFLGFHLINSLFVIEKRISWGMITAIFLWLILMTIFIMMSFMVEVSQKHYEETKAMHNLIREQQREIEKEQIVIDKKLKS